MQLNAHMLNNQSIKLSLNGCLIFSSNIKKFYIYNIIPIYKLTYNSSSQSSLVLMLVNPLPCN